MKNFKWWDNLTQEEQSHYRKGVCDFMRGREEVLYKFISDETIEIYYPKDLNLPPAFTHYKSLLAEN